MPGNKRIIILLGPPGAGKGTQSELLSGKFNVYYFETSKILERTFNSQQRKKYLIVEGKKYYFEKEKKYWQTGKLCSPPFVSELVEEEIKELHKFGKGIIFAGSPRTIYEAGVIIPLLKKLYGKKNITTILLKISAKESIFRNSHRRICELFRHPIIYNQETKNLKRCPLDGSKLIRRKGLDNPKTIKVRLEEYKERTLPIISYFKKAGIKVSEVNGEGAVADIFKRICNKISRGEKIK